MVDQSTKVSEVFQTKNIVFLVIFLLSLQEIAAASSQIMLPVVVNTWDFYAANLAAWDALYNKRMSPMESMIAGGSQCDVHRACDVSVGWGGHPDETGETTQDAMVMDGPTHDVGSVGDLRRIKPAMSVAHAVMKYTTNTMLVGEAATKFAVEMGYKEEDLHSNESISSWKRWKKRNCQPNYRQNVLPDPRHHCGPYRPKSATNSHPPRTHYKSRQQPHNILRYRSHLSTSPTKLKHTPEVKSKHTPEIKSKHTPEVRKSNSDTQRYSRDITSHNHDTIGMIVIGEDGHIVAGTTTNGLKFKVPGRVGDSPMVGAGAYVDNEVGAAVGTGDGDVMMRFVPSYQAVAYMETGHTPEMAATLSIKKIIKYYPGFSGAILAINTTGHYGAACHHMYGNNFPFLVRNPHLTNTTLIRVPCV